MLTAASIVPISDSGVSFNAESAVAIGLPRCLSTAAFTPSIDQSVGREEMTKCARDMHPRKTHGTTDSACSKAA